MYGFSPEDGGGGAGDPRKGEIYFPPLSLLLRRRNIERDFFLSTEFFFGGEGAVGQSFKHKSWALSFLWAQIETIILQSHVFWKINNANSFFSSRKILTFSNILFLWKIREFPVFAIRKMSFRQHPRPTATAIKAAHLFPAFLLCASIPFLGIARPTPTQTLGPAKCKGFKVFTNFEFRIRI